MHRAEFGLKIVFVAYFPESISKHFNNPQNGGEAVSFNCDAANASFICGSAIRFSLRIEGQIIEEIRFKTNGCGFLVAAADRLADLVKGKNLASLHGLDRIESEIERELGEFPAERRHCLALSIETLRRALADFRKTLLDEFKGEIALICTCFGVSEGEVEKLVSENCQTVEEVSAKCNAGAGCGSCQPLIQEIIDSR